MARAIGAHGRRREAKKFVGIWTDSCVHSTQRNTTVIVQKLRSIFDVTLLAEDTTVCRELLNDLNTDNVVIISSAEYSEELLSVVDRINFVRAVYILGAQITGLIQLQTQYSKLIGVYQNIDSICREIRKTADSFHNGPIDVAIIDIDGIDDAIPDFSRFDPPFMYTRLLKNALLTVDHEIQPEMKIFVENAEGKYLFNERNQDLEYFKNEYRSENAIRWYTRESFLYKLLNNALRELKGDIIVDLGFYLCDLHRQIQRLHQQQRRNTKSDQLIYYRSVVFPKATIEGMRRSVGGLMGFSNFLSTSSDRSIVMEFFQALHTNQPNHVAALLKIVVNPKLNVVPFADIHEYSEYPDECETLFSMNSVFRINAVERYNEVSNGFEIELELTAEDDPKLKKLTEYMEKQANGDGWYRIGWILIDMNRLEKAEEIYLDLLNKNPTPYEEANCKNQLGVIKIKQKKYPEAVAFYKQALDIYKKRLGNRHPNLGSTYNNLGLAHSSMGDYSQALTYYQQDLELSKKIYPEGDVHIASSYSNIALAYSNLNNLSQALTYFMKALDIYEKELPDDHPDLANVYNNIAGVYDKMKNYQEALQYFEKALAIRQHVLPVDHPDIAIVYNNIAWVYRAISDFPQALSFYEKAYQIWTIILPEDDTDLVDVRKSIKRMRDKMKN